MLILIINFRAYAKGTTSLPVEDKKEEIEPSSKKLKTESEEKSEIDMSDARRLVKKAIARNKLSS